MASLSWWRSWHGAPTDHKWAVIAARSGVKVGIVSAIAWALLDYASQHKERGCVEGFDIETYAVYSGFSEQEINAVITAMQDKGVIVSSRLAKWEERQPKREDETGYKRVQEWREKKRNETQCNARNAPDKDTDTEKINTAPLARVDLDGVELPPIVANPGAYRAVQQFERDKSNGKRDYSWLPDNTRPLAQAFYDSSGIDPAPKERGLWQMSLLQLYEMRATPKIVTDVTAKMRRNKLTLKSPQSIIANTRDYITSLTHDGEKWND